MGGSLGWSQEYGDFLKSIQEVRSGAGNTAALWIHVSGRMCGLSTQSAAFRALLLELTGIHWDVFSKWWKDPICGCAPLACLVCQHYFDCSGPSSQVAKCKIGEAVNKLRKL